ncbi:unnamed protein product, partial [Prorocentrum cordatum]
DQREVVGDLGKPFGANGGVFPRHRTAGALAVEALAAPASGSAGASGRSPPGCARAAASCCSRARTATRTPGRGRPGGSPSDAPVLCVAARAKAGLAGAR